MQPSRQTPALEELATLLDEAEALLRQYRETRWADVLRTAAQGIRQSDREGRLLSMKRLLSAFGGMGSLNDLVLFPPDGPVIRRTGDFPASARRDNDRLDRLRGEISTRVRDLSVDLRNEAIS